MRLVMTAMCGLIARSPNPWSCHESSSSTAISPPRISGSMASVETPRMLPPRCARFPAETSTWWIICATVDLPRVPVTPMITTPISAANFAKSAVDMYTGTPAERATAISDESSRTPAALMTMFASVKSAEGWPPIWNVMFGYSLRRSTDSFNSSSLFVSVIVTRAPMRARNPASPTLRPKRPRPRTVTRLFLKKGSYGAIRRDYLYSMFVLREQLDDAAPEMLGFLGCPEVDQARAGRIEAAFRLFRDGIGRVEDIDRAEDRTRLFLDDSAGERIVRAPEKKIIECLAPPLGEFGADDIADLVLMRAEFDGARQVAHRMLLEDDHASEGGPVDVRSHRRRSRQKQDLSARILAHRTCCRTRHLDDIRAFGAVLQHRGRHGIARAHDLLRAEHTQRAQAIGREV